MKYVVYCVYDKVAKLYSNPTLAINTQDAIRSFNNYVDKMQNKDDFVLTWLGFWNNVNGSISSLDKVFNFMATPIVDDSNLDNVEAVLYE